MTSRGKGFVPLASVDFYNVVILSNDVAKNL